MDDAIGGVKDFSLQTFDLVPARIMKFGGEFRFMKGTATNFNIMGEVRKVQLPPDNIVVTILEPGAYLLDFQSAPTIDWQTPLVHHIKQDRLMMGGCSLTLNLNPMYGLLDVNYRMVVEQGMSLGTLLWRYL